MLFVEYINNPTIVLTILSFLFITLLFFVIKYISVKKSLRRFSGIISIEEEQKLIVETATKTLRDIELKKQEETNRIAQMKREFEEHKKLNIKREQDKIDKLQLEKKKLKEQYGAGSIKYKELSEKLSELEENYDMIEVGLYKPSFDFGTSEECKNKLVELYQKQKEMIKAKAAASCSVKWSVGNSRVEGRRMTKRNIDLTLRAFNGECEAGIANVKWNNFDKLQKKIEKAYSDINKFNEPNKIVINKAFKDLRLEQLRVKYQELELRHKEKEEYRVQMEEQRELEKVQKEIEKKIAEAAKEEERDRKALEDAKRALESTYGKENEELQNKIKELEERIAHDLAEKERAMSMAQQTKRGCVYIISNIGAFGDNIFKIGLTRRLVPEERIQELSGAAVPFEYDIHAMIRSEDAPALETELHHFFADKRVNLVNGRKEFFNISLEDINNWAKKSGKKIDWLNTMPEARSYRETLSIREKGIKEIEKAKDKMVIDEDLFDEEDMKI
jgi:hypothetical protein